MATLDVQFDAAIKIVQSLPKDGPVQTPNDVKLKFYSYYKQATIGKCNTAQPWFYEVENRAKWNAWNELGDMAQVEAKKMYVQELKTILEKSAIDDADEEIKKQFREFLALVQ